MEHPPYIHGTSREHPWNIHGTSMEHPRNIHGTSTEHPWNVHPPPFLKRSCYKVETGSIVSRMFENVHFVQKRSQCSKMFKIGGKWSNVIKCGAGVTYPLTSALQHSNIVLQLQRHDVISRQIARVSWNLFALLKCWIMAEQIAIIPLKGTIGNSTSSSRAMVRRRLAWEMNFINHFILSKWT